MHRRDLIKKKSVEGTYFNTWFDSGLSIDNRTIILNSDSEDGSIDVKMSLQIIKCMSVLESINNDPICVIINSVGGDIHCSFAIYDRLKESSCPICIRGYGAIMSGASIIMQAAELRQMTPNSCMMIHDGSVMLDNDMNKAKKWVKAYDDMSSNMYDIYYNAAHKKNKKITREQISTMCKEETILTAKQALDLGFIDQIYIG